MLYSSQTLKSIKKLVLHPRGRKGTAIAGRVATHLLLCPDTSNELSAGLVVAAMQQVSRGVIAIDAKFVVELYESAVPSDRLGIACSPVIQFLSAPDFIRITSAAFGQKNINNSDRVHLLHNVAGFGGRNGVGSTARLHGALQRHAAMRNWEIQATAISAMRTTGRISAADVRMMIAAIGSRSERKQDAAIAVLCDLLSESESVPDDVRELLSSFRARRVIGSVASSHADPYIRANASTLLVRIGVV